MAVDGGYGLKGYPKFDPNGAPEDWVDLEAVGAFAAKVGNRLVGTKAQRLALTAITTGADQAWAGVEFFETDTGQTFLCMSTSPLSWVRSRARQVVARKQETAEVAIATGGESNRWGEFTLPTRGHVVVTVTSSWLSTGNAAATVTPYLDGVKYTNGLLAATTPIHNNNRANVPFTFRSTWEADLSAGSHTAGVWISVDPVASPITSLNMYLDVTVDY